MNVYIWVSINNVSDSYHDDGGLLVVAESLESARAMLADSSRGDKYLRALPPECDALKVEPEYIWPLASAVEPVIIVFPNAGC